MDQQIDQSSDAALTLSANWGKIKMTLSRIQDQGIKNLDSPTDGLGSRYNVNLNHKIHWVAGIGPVCDEELLPAKSKDVIHPGKFIIQLIMKNNKMYHRCHQSEL